MMVFSSGSNQLEGPKMDFVFQALVRKRPLVRGAKLAHNRIC